MLVLALGLTLAWAASARAMTLLRDADVEHALAYLSFPILRAAGLNPSQVRVLVVNDPQFNAFVIDNRTIFVHYGLILKVANASVLQAVIAHEAAHISNGHITRRMANMKSARTTAGLGAALAVIAAAAGAGDAAAGLAAGSSSAAMRSFLSHTRAEEAAADRSAAAYLRASGVSPQGLVELHEAFQGHELLNIGQQDPYTRSHPLTRDRIRAAQAFVAAYGAGIGPPDAEATYWFDRAKAKISAFTRSPKWTMQRADDESHADLRLMREAIAYHRLNDFDNARRSIDAALAERPDDAYLMDLKAQILMENRRWSEAIAVYARAVELAPRDALILGGHGRALLAGGQPKAALVELEKARARDFRDARLLRDLGTAYAQTDQPGMAALATAERYALLGRMEDAGLHGRRAVGLLPRGSAGWQRAQDVVAAADQFEKRKR